MTRPKYTAFCEAHQARRRLVGRRPELCAYAAASHGERNAAWRQFTEALLKFTTGDEAHHNIRAFYEDARHTFFRRRILASIAFLLSSVVRTTPMCDEIKSNAVLTSTRLL